MAKRLSFNQLSASVIVFLVLFPEFEKLSVASSDAPIMSEF